MSASDFLKSVKNKKTIFNRSKKKEASQGYVEDSDIIEMFDLKPNKGVTAKARLRSCKIVNVNGTPILKTNFLVTEGPNKGTPLSNDVWINLDDDERLEQALDTINFMFQSLGYTTSDLSMEDIPKIVEELTANQPYCVVYLNCYKLRSGKNKGQLRYGLRVNGVYEPDLSSVGKSNGSSAALKVHKEEPEEDTEEAYEEAEAEDDLDEDDPNTWIDYSAKVMIDGETITVTITSYDSETDTLEVVDSDDEKHQISPDAVVDWA